MIRILLTAMMVFFCTFCNAQKLLTCYDSVFKFHISLPESWKILSRNRGHNNPKTEYSESFFYAEEIINKNDFKTIHLSSFHVIDTARFVLRDKDSQDALFKCITTKQEKGKVRISDRYHVTSSKYDTIGHSYNFSHGGLESYPYIFVTFTIISNDEVFTLQFDCPTSEFDNHIQSFIDIANSVYFD